MKTFQWLAKKTFLNWRHPIYSQRLFLFCSRYVDLWYGDNNFDRETNGEFWLLKKLMPVSKVIIDVGANVGIYSGEILRINPAVQIHAFEPDPRAFNELSRLSLRANQLALGETEETKSLHLAPHSTHNSFNFSEGGDNDLIVPVSTLDRYCAEQRIGHIDFLKVDVEGYEFSVLRGAFGLFKDKRIDYAQFEFSGATQLSRVFLKDFLEFFEGYGYILYTIRAKDLKMVDYHPDRERYTLTNYLAIRDGMPVPKE